MSSSKDLISRFGLDIEQTKLMFSMQYLLINEDIYFENDEEKKHKKKLWMYNWKKSIESYLTSIDSEKCNSIYKSKYRLYEYISQIEELLQTKFIIDKFTAYLILLEVSLFRPYYPMDTGDEEQGVFKKVNLLFNKSEVSSMGVLNRKCKLFAKLLGINPSYVLRFNNNYERSIRGISKFWNKVVISGVVFAIVVALTAGIAATTIAPFFAPAGLHGAAAISAGLAALGGGAIAAGGYGMAGGMAVLVGGGAIIGAAGGAGTGVLLSNSSDLTLLQASKLEVIFKEVILGIEKDVELAQEIFDQITEYVKNLENELFSLQQQNKNTDKIKNLEKSLRYMKTLLERLKDKSK